MYIYIYSQKKKIENIVKQILRARKKRKNKGLFGKCFPKLFSILKNKKTPKNMLGNLSNVLFLVSYFLKTSSTCLTCFLHYLENQRMGFFFVFLLGVFFVFSSVSPLGLQYERLHQQPKQRKISKRKKKHRKIFEIIEKNCQKKERKKNIQKNKENFLEKTGKIFQKNNEKSP